MARSSSSLEQARQTHERAAANHDRAAAVWAAQNDHDRADLERRTAQIERDAAELEAAWARLLRERVRARTHG